MASDDHSTRTRLLTLLDLIDLIQSLPLIRLPQLLSQSVVANRPSVHHRMRREDVLRVCITSLDRSDHTTVSKTHSSPTRSVLGRSPRNVRDLIVFHDLLVPTAKRSSADRGR